LKLWKTLWEKPKYMDIYEAKTPLKRVEKIKRKP
jgi:hypothetical protein